jgi:hypothetical protein
MKFPVDKEFAKKLLASPVYSGREVWELSVEYWFRIENDAEKFSVNKEIRVSPSVSSLIKSRKSKFSPGL